MARTVSLFSYFLVCTLLFRLFFLLPVLHIIFCLSSFSPQRPLLLFLVLYRPLLFVLSSLFLPFSSPSLLACFSGLALTVVFRVCKGCALYILLLLQLFMAYVIALSRAIFLGSMEMKCKSDICNAAFTIFRSI